MFTKKQLAIHIILTEIVKIYSPNIDIRNKI